MSNPKELKYTKSHEWVREIGDGIIEMGLTDHAQESLGDLVFVNLPSVSDDVTMGESMADVESVKAVSDVYSPVTGKVSEVNEALLDEPGEINKDPYGAWLVRISDVSDMGEIISSEEYEAFLAEEA